MSLIFRAALRQLKPYIPGKSKWELEKQLGRDDLLRLSFNETPLGPSSKAVQAMKDFLPQIHLYPDASYTDLKQKLAQIWGRQPENFIIGDGTDEVITMLAQTYVDAGDEVILGEPTFGAYRLGVTIQGGRIFTVPLKNFQYDLDVYLNAVTAKTKLLFLCNPNNPTGTYINKNQLTAFLQKLPPHVVVVLDEAYADYATAADFPSGNDFLDEYNVVVLRTFSKMFGLAGLRIGYGLAKPEIIYDLNRVREPFNVNQLAAVGALAALDDVEYLRLGRETNETGKQLFYRQLTAMGLKYLPTEANFIWAEVGCDSKELEAALLREAITIRGGYAFRSPAWVRFTIGTMADNERFLQALQVKLGELAKVVYEAN